jgi:response regulator of citrate/malate metabolism
MIRVVVVDDDFRIAGIHAAYVDKVDGFQAIAQVHTAAEAIAAVDRLRPDLLLLDLYLPDEHGLELVARLRRDGHPPVDVIVITAAKDADSVRAAMQGGALHYLLKPFGFPALRDKLLSYGQMRSRLSALHEPDQRSVDRVFGALRAPDQLAGAKGRSPHTLEAVERLFVSGEREMSAAEVAEMTGMSRATAQRYLSHLHEMGRVDIRLRYGSGGRPEHRYRWRRTGQELAVLRGGSAFSGRLRDRGDDHLEGGAVAVGAVHLDRAVVGFGDDPAGGHGHRGQGEHGRLHPPQPEAVDHGQAHPDGQERHRLPLREQPHRRQVEPGEHRPGDVRRHRTEPPQDAARRGGRRPGATSADLWGRRGWLVAAD